MATLERSKNLADAAVDRARDAVLSSTDQAQRGIDAAASHASDSAHQAGDSVRAATRSVAAGAHRRIERTTALLERGYGRARRDLSRGADNVSDYCGRHPGVALSAAAAAGFLVGVLVRGWRR
jgi:ElaB/YqjD/DUF883 family membrane-anchored ribosome-binding protein